MLDFLASARSKDEAPKATASVQSLSGSQLSGSEPRSEHEPLEKTENEKKKGFFSLLFARPFTRRRITILGALGFLIVAILVLVITLPIVLTRAHKHKDPGDVYRLYPTKHEDPSYRILENKPVYAIHNFPDPGLLNHNGTWYAYGTNPHKRDPQSIHVPVATSTDFVKWTLHEGYDAMPTLGDWEVAQNHWAPDVIERVSSCSAIPESLRISISDNRIGRWKVRSLLRRSNEQFQQAPLHRRSGLERHESLGTLYPTQRIPSLSSRIWRCH